MYRILHFTACLAMWMFCFLHGALAASLDNNSGQNWMAPKQGRSQENDVIKSNHRKKFQNKPAPTMSSKTRHRLENESYRRKGTGTYSSEDLKLQLFLEADKNGDGFVSSREYAKAKTMNMEEAHMVLQSFDGDNDGLVSKAEYLKVSAYAVPDTRRKGVQENRDCRIELINACAVNLIKSVIRGQGHLRCTRMKVFTKCVERKSRKCNTSTKRRLRSIVRDMSWLIASKKCSLRKKHRKWRQLSSVSRTRNDEKSCQPTQLLVCSRELLKNLISSDRNCETALKYKNCMRRSYSQCQRPIRRRLRHSVRTVRKACRKFSGCP